MMLADRRWRQEGFVRQYDVKFRRPAELPEAKCEDLNSIKVALKYGQTNGRKKLTKGTWACMRFPASVGCHCPAGLADLALWILQTW